MSRELLETAVLMALEARKWHPTVLPGNIAQVVVEEIENADDPSNHAELERLILERLDAAF